MLCVVSHVFLSSTTTHRNGWRQSQDPIGRRSGHELRRSPLRFSSEGVSSSIAIIMSRGMQISRKALAAALLGTSTRRSGVVGHLKSTDSQSTITMSTRPRPNHIANQSCSPNSSVVLLPSRPQRNHPPSTRILPSHRRRLHYPLLQRIPVFAPSHPNPTLNLNQPSRTYQPGGSPTSSRPHRN